MRLSLGSPEFNHLILSLLRRAESESANRATNVLRDLVAAVTYSFRPFPNSVPSLIQGIISLGADPHAIGVPLTYFSGERTRTYTQKMTAFGLILLGSLNYLRHGGMTTAQPFLDAIAATAPTCLD